MLSHKCLDIRKHYIWYDNRFRILALQFTYLEPPKKTNLSADFSLSLQVNDQVEGNFTKALAFTRTQSPATNYTLQKRRRTSQSTFPIQYQIKSQAQFGSL